MDYKVRVLNQTGSIVKQELKMNNMDFRMAAMRDCTSARHDNIQRTPGVHRMVADGGSIIEYEPIPTCKRDIIEMYGETHEIYKK